MAKGLPAISYNLQKAGHALIDRSDPKQAIPEIERFAKSIQENKYLGVIFPEGTRARRGALKRFKTKGALTFLKYAPEADVLTLTIDDSWKLKCKDLTLMPRNTKVSVIVSKEIKRKDKSDKEILDIAYQTIEENLNKLRNKKRG